MHRQHLGQCLARKELFLLKERVTKTLQCNENTASESCDIWLDLDTLQSGWRIFPRAARPSNAAREQAGSEEASEEVTCIPQR